MMAELKPYPAMKDSSVCWLGEVPEHWEIRKLKYAVSFAGGGTPSKANASFWNGHIPWVSPKDMRSGRITDATDHITDEAVRASATSPVSPGAVIIVVRSGILRRTIPVAINEVQVALNQDMKALRPCPGILSEYLRALVQGNEAKLITEWTKQGATVESIEHQFLANSQIPFPPLPEQAAIVRFLDHVDRRIRRYIRAKQKLIKLLEEQKQAIIHRAVTRGLDPNVRLKPSGVEWLGDVPEHWEVRRIQGVFRERKETGQPNLPILVVSIAHGVTKGDEIDEDGRPKRLIEDKALYKVAHKGDIAYNMMRMWQGAVGVVPEDGLVSPAYVVAQPHDRMNSKYFALLFRTEACKGDTVSRSRGIVDDRNRLYWDGFKDLRVPVPPYNEQNVIVVSVTDQTKAIANSVERASREITLVREYGSRLVADVVSGKLDVREAAERLPHEMEEPESTDEVEADADVEADAADEIGAIPEEHEA